MDAPVPRYIDRDGAALAFQVFGDGPVDVVYAGEITMHFDLAFADPHLHHVFERGSHYSRAVYVQRRGIGLSDRVGYVPTAEQQASDILAVMDAVGMASATILALTSSVPPVLLLAAQSPERVRSLLLVNPMPGIAEPDPDDGWTDESFAEFHRALEAVFEGWGSGLSAGAWSEVLDSPFNRRLMAVLERCSASPETARTHWEWAQQLDVRELLSAIGCPVKVLYQPGGCYPEAVVRRAADRIPDATFAMLPAARPRSSIGESWVPVTDHLQEMATGVPPAKTEDRFLGTVLFTDLVGSTELLAEIGDTSYREIRAAHEREVRHAVDMAGGELVTVMGDGTLSVFLGPTAAIRCAEAIREAANEDGLALRCGVHTGELERDGSNVTGLAVHIGARVSGAGRPGEIVVSRTVRDLTAGSGLQLTSRGETELKGVPGTWELFTLSGSKEQGLDLPPAPTIDTAMDRLAVRTARRWPRMVRFASRMGNRMDRPMAGL